MEEGFRIRSWTGALSGLPLTKFCFGGKEGEKGRKSEGVGEMKVFSCV